MSTRPPKRIYSWLDYVEELEFYAPGGFMPITLGDTLASPLTKYKLMHKLGYGSYSTVWLAQDTTAISPRLVAVKVMAAHPEDTGRSNELAILAHLPPHPHIAPLHETFTTESPNGTHTCIVTDPQGPSIFSLRYESDDNRLPAAVGRVVAAQVVEAVANLHAHGVVHGDLHLSNILLRVPDFASWTPESVLERFGPPRVQPLEREDDASPAPHGPLTVVRPIHPQKLAPYCLPPAASPSVCITDFGESIFTSASPRHLHTARTVAAPEILFDDIDAIGPPADVWALGCALYEILGDNSLFPAVFGDKEEVLTEIVSALGSPPDLWSAHCADLSREPGSSLQDRVRDIMCTEGSERFDEEEMSVFASVLEKMMRWEPSERISAAEALQALPASWRLEEAVAKIVEETVAAEPSGDGQGDGQRANIEEPKPTDVAVIPAVANAADNVTENSPSPPPAATPDPEPQFWKKLHAPIMQEV